MTLKIGRWDCLSCGHKGILGPKLHCTECGSPRHEKPVFYLPTNAEIVINLKQIKEAKSGANWHCNYCHSPNLATNIKCTSCGQVYEGNNVDPSLYVIDYGINEAPSNSLEADEIREEIERNEENEKWLNSKPNVKSKISINIPWKYILYGLSGIGVVFLITLLFWTTPIDLNVTQHQWKTNVSVQQYDYRFDDGWDLPANGELLKSYSKFHHNDQVFDHYEKVIDHYDQVYDHTETHTKTESYVCKTEEYECGQKDLGNGYFETKYCTRDVYCDREVEYEEKIYKDIPVYADKVIYRDEPRYQTYYEYKYLDWIERRIETSNGIGITPLWTDVNIPNNKWKLVNDNGLYTITFVSDDNESFQRTFDSVTWKQYRDGQKLKASKYLVWGTITDLPF